MESEPLSYEKFRTGLTYHDVYHMIYTRKHKRRHGVLGYWRQLKLQMYEQYLREFQSGSDYIPSETIPW